MDVLKRRNYLQSSSTNLPSEAGLEQAVLFSQQRLGTLHQRIASLEDENRAERAHFKELHRVKSRLERAKVARESQLVQLKGKCDDLQMLKCA